MRSLLLREWQAFLRYEELPGGAPPILYLSGLGMPSHAVLGARRSVFIDLLGCGFSDAPDDFDYTLEQHTRTVAMLLDHLGVAGCDVAGYSMGGAVAITLAATRPDLVSRLALLEANLDPLGPGEGAISTGIAGQTEDGFCAEGFDDLLAFCRRGGLEGDDTAAAFAGAIQVAAPHALHRSAVHLVRATRPTMRERLLDMDMPRAYIFGEKSLPDPDYDALAREGIQVLIVPEAGHGMLFDNPAGVAKALAIAFGM